MDDDVKLRRWVVVGTNERGANQAAATTVTLGGGDYFQITGSGVTIAMIQYANSWNGRRAKITFTGANTLQHSGTFILPTGANIAVVANDTIEIVQLSTGSIQVIDYSKASGTPLVGLQPANNLSDVANAAAAASNIGVGAEDTPTFTGVRATGLNSTTGGVGYPEGLGVGDDVTQITSRSTAVTSNNMCGLIRGRSDSLAAGGRATFKVNNSAIKNEDVVILNIERAGDPTFATDPPQSIHWVSDGNDDEFYITIWNLSGTADVYAYYYRWAIIPAAFN